MKKRETIAVVSATPVIRFALSSILRNTRDYEQVLETSSLYDMSKTLRGTYPILLVLDLTSFPQKTKLEEVRYAATLYPSVKIVVFDKPTDLSLVLNFLTAGIKGYIAFHYEHDDISMAITAILSGERFLDPELFWSLVEQFPVGKPADTLMRTSTKLTDNESRIAKLLIQGVKVGEIAKSLNRKPSTISTIKKQVLKKYNVSNVLELKDIMYSDLNAQVFSS